jgi:lipopolysaccharide transport system ATP-binding protein
MTDIAIKVENISKKYTIGLAQQKHDTLRDLLVDAVHSPFKKNGKERQEQSILWALKDVSFEVKHGEAVGIIGRNGAGKSTLLKILSRITEPSDGRAIINGRVASLLEVGTGFHPELTGRENIFLNGAILGMRRSEIERKFDEIVAFSEIEKFLDTPVKRYSSGMYLRLAFAVAAHLEPEILLVDEVLAVGDAVFQKKCLGKLNEVAREGKTVIFVSHNMGAITSLTEKTIYMILGTISDFGSTKTVVKKYLKSSLDLVNPGQDIPYFFHRDSTRDIPIEITKIWPALLQNEIYISKLEMGENFQILIELKAYRKVNGAQLSVDFYNELGEKVTLLYSWDKEFRISVEAGIHLVKVAIKGLHLPPGNYYINVGINQSTETRAFDVIKNYPIFQIIKSDQIIYWPDRPWGIIHVDSVEWYLCT